MAVLLAKFYNRTVHIGGFIKSSPVLRLLRFARFMRFARTAKMWFAMPEILTFVEGMLKGMRVVAKTLILLAGTIYMFAIVFTQLLGDMEEGKDCFETVLMSMHFLFVTALCSIDKNFIFKMLNAGWIYWILWMAFLLTANLTIMRMVTGMILNVVTTVNNKYKDYAQKCSLEHEISKLIAALDHNETGSISKDEFETLVHNEHIMEDLVELGVDLSFFVENMLSEWPSDAKVPISSIVARTFHLRGSNAVTLADAIRSSRHQEHLIQAQHVLLEEQIRAARCS